MGIRVYVDGCTLGNHQKNVSMRKSYIGLIVEDAGNRVVEKIYACPCDTNNETEFYAMMAGIILAEQLKSDLREVEFISDSKLLVNSVRGKNKLKNKILILRLEQLRAIMAIHNVLATNIFWHPRENNKAGHMLDDMRMQNILVAPKANFVLEDVKTWQR